MSRITQTILRPDVHAALGTAPDAVVASWFGARPLAIHRWRKKLGIPKCGADKHRRSRLRDLVPAELQAKLGTAPDKVLAKELGLPWKQVAYLRAKLGLGRKKGGRS